MGVVSNGNVEIRSPVVEDGGYIPNERFSKSSKISHWFRNLSKRTAEQLPNAGVEGGGRKDGRKDGEKFVDFMGAFNKTLATLLDTPIGRESTYFQQLISAQ